MEEIAVQGVGRLFEYGLVTTLLALSILAHAWFFLKHLPALHKAHSDEVKLLNDERRKDQLQHAGEMKDANKQLNDEIRASNDRDKEMRDMFERATEKFQTLLEVRLGGK